MTDKASVNPGAFSHSAGDPPARRLCLWPHRSLPRRGFVWFIAATFVMLMLPMLALLGTIALWVLLPFLMGALALLWYFLERSYKDGALLEELCLWQDHARLIRSNPRSGNQVWEANPHWIDVLFSKDSGPVENYVTLRGGGREVEIGAFLSPEERKVLHRELLSGFAELRAVMAD